MRILMTLAICAFLATPALAAFQGPGAGGKGGFEGPIGGAQADTVEKAKTLGDDSPVVLTGEIVEQIAGSKDKYMFKDHTGQIRVDIDRKAFRGQDVTPKDTVRISGKIDKDFNEPIEVDVKHLEVIKR